MPKLPTFTVQHQTLGAEISGGRRATAADMGAGVGEALQAAGGTVQKAVTEYRDEQEAGDGRQVLMRNAQIREKYGKLLDEAELAGGDTDKVRQDMDDELAGVRGEMQTQRGIQYADQHSAGTGQLFDGKVGQIKVERARAEAITGGQQLMQANGALIYGNPSYLSMAEESIDSYAATQTRLPPHARAKLATDLKEQARTQAAMRRAELDPEGTQAALKAGTLGLSPEQTIQVGKAAEQEINHRKVEARQAKADERAAREEASNAARGSWFRTIESSKPGEFAKLHRQIIADKSLDEMDVQALVAHIDAKLDEKSGGAPTPAQRLAADRLAVRIFAPDGDPEKIADSKAIYDALRAGEITLSQFRPLMNDVAYLRDPNNTTVGKRMSQSRHDVYSAMMNHPAYKHTPMLVPIFMAKWDAKARDGIAQAREKGVTPAYLFDANDRNNIVNLTTLNQMLLESQNEAGAALRGVSAAAAGATQFPDGITRRYNGSGDRLDMKNWTVVEPGEQPATPPTAAAARPRDTFNGVVVPPPAARGQSFEARIRAQYPRRRGESTDGYEQRIANLAKQAREGGAE